MLGLAQGVLLADVGVGDAVQQHVHLADGPGGAHFLLAKEAHVASVLALLTHVVAHLDEHAAGAHRGVVHAHAILRVADFYADAHHLGRGVKLARLFACGVGKVFDEPLVRCAQQVGELEVAVFERDLVKVLDEVGQRVVVQRGLADFAVEVDGAFEHVLQGFVVLFFQFLQRLVEHAADVDLQVFERGVVNRLGFAILDCVFGPRGAPTGAGRHVEIFAGVLVFVFQIEGDVYSAETGDLPLLLDLLTTLIKQVAGALEKKHTKDVFLVLAGVHVAAQCVAGGHQQVFQAGEGEFGSGHGG